MSKLMIPLKYIAKWLLLCAVGIVILGGCKNSETSSEEVYEIVHADMQYFDFDCVSSLSLFFDSIFNEHGLPVRDIDEDESFREEIAVCIERLEGYRKGKYKYYPDSLVRSCINVFGHECAFLANHASDLDMTYAEWFLMLSAFYSPDITCLVHMQTPNHYAGIQDFGSQYNDSPWWSYLFLKREKGFEVRRIMGDETRIEKIYQLEDNKHRLYYLCSNNISNLEFLQVLFWVKDSCDVVLAAQCDSLPQNYKAGFEDIYFDPKQRVWHYCKEDKESGKLIPVSDAPALRLCLDGLNSRFILNE